MPKTCNFTSKMSADDQRLQRWRLILGQEADPDNEVALPKAAKGMDRVLQALYGDDRKGGLGKSSPQINRWLGDIRRYFPTPMVRLLQRDALERLDLKRMLLEPELLESIEPDVELVGTILTLNKAMPDETRESARLVVRRLVDQLERELQLPLRQAIRGSLDRAARNRRPKLNEIDWHRTIRANLKHYQPEYKTIIPERLYGYGRKQAQLRDVIVLADQSGSMASSVVYASIFSCIMAGMRALYTRFVAFDTAVADLSEHLEDPVDLLFATQLGGGTDIGKALAYAQSLIRRPQETILVLISDLYEGGREAEMIRLLQQIQASGVTVISLLALNDQGAPAYNKQLAKQVAAMDMVCFACTPEEFPPLMAAAIEKRDLKGFGNRKM
jgi:Mg-chelatase subunit ChlD